MGFQRWFLQQLGRGDEPVTDPDEPVELTDVPVHEGPMLLRALHDAGIEAQGFEGVDVTTKSSTRFRVVVRRRDLQRARAIHAHHL